jgi:plasmid stabilization system protein ParE
MPRTLRFHPAARTELREAVVFYADQSPGLGRDLVREVRAVAERIQLWPESASMDESDVRRAMLSRFPFTVVYQVSPDAIDVIAVMHQRQRPGYWRDRL